MISEYRYQTSKNLLCFILFQCIVLHTYSLQTIFCVHFEKRPIGRDGSGSFKQKMILLMPKGMLKKHKEVYVTSKVIYIMNGGARGDHKKYFICHVYKKDLAISQIFIWLETFAL